MVSDITRHSQHWYIGKAGTAESPPLRRLLAAQQANSASLPSSPTASGGASGFSAYRHAASSSPPNLAGLQRKAGRPRAATDRSGGRSDVKHQILSMRRITRWPRQADPPHRRRSSRSGTRLPAGPWVSMAGRPAGWEGAGRALFKNCQIVRARRLIPRSSMRGGSRSAASPAGSPAGNPPKVRSASCGRGWNLVGGGQQAGRQCVARRRQ